jgi:RNA polymerase sigma-70 factor (ECF subfamily)
MEEAVRHDGLALERRLAAAGDVELVAACAEGIPEAFRELLSRYRRSAVGLAYQMLGNMEDAEDVAQEAFVRVFVAIPKFRGQAAFSTWLYRIVTNLCLGDRRRRRRTVDLEAVREPRAADNPAGRVTDGLLAGEILSEMAVELRAILLLREQEGLSYRDIAEALDLPLGTVRSRLSKARMTFRRLWNEALQSGEE